MGRCGTVCGRFSSWWTRALEVGTVGVATVLNEVLAELLQLFFLLLDLLLMDSLCSLSFIFECNLWRIDLIIFLSGHILSLMPRNSWRLLEFLHQVVFVIFFSLLDCAERLRWILLRDIGSRHAVLTVPITSREVSIRHWIALGRWKRAVVQGAWCSVSWQKRSLIQFDREWAHCRRLQILREVTKIRWITFQRACRVRLCWWLIWIFRCLRCLAEWRQLVDLWILCKWGTLSFQDSSRLNFRVELFWIHRCEIRLWALIRLLRFHWALTSLPAVWSEGVNGAMREVVGIAILRLHVRRRISIHFEIWWVVEVAAAGGWARELVRLYWKICRWQHSCSLFLLAPEHLAISLLDLRFLSTREERTTFCRVVLADWVLATMAHCRSESDLAGCLDPRRYESQIAIVLIW